MRLANVLAFGVVVLLATRPARATDVNLDPTFGTFGQVVVDIGAPGDTAAQDVLVQPDGAIVAAGFDADRVALVRVTSSGALDATFGTGGIVTTDVGGGSASALARQSDGKLVVAGPADVETNSKFMVARYGADGTLDATFGTGGIVKTDIGPEYDAAVGLTIQADGKIVVCGYRVDSGAVVKVAATVVRYLDDGTLDAGFGTGGIVLLALAQGSIATDVTLQADGKIVVGGEAGVSTGNVAFLVARLDADGTIDGAFGSSGMVITDFSFDTDIANAVSVLPDGRIVAGGHHGGRFAAARYLSNGSPDGAFGVGGTTVVDVVPGFDIGFDMVVQPDGRIVLAGYGQRGDFGNNGADLAVVRLDTAGAPDGTFAPGGGATLRLGDASTLATGIARQADGKLVVAGWSVTADNESSLFIARLGGTCGDGTIDAGEQCDDANVNGLDCCSPGCGLIAAGGTCELDGNICTSDVCDGAGTCTLGGPAVVCRAPAAPKKAKLTIVDAVDATRDRLDFKWTKGLISDFSEFGLPQTFTDYTLCIFAGPGSAPPLVYQGEIPAGPVWALKNYSYVYKDVSGTNAGVVRALLQGPLGRPAKVILKAKGPNVAPPSLALATPVTAQLRGTNGSCFGATFATPSVNTTSRFKATGQ